MSQNREEESDGSLDCGGMMASVAMLRIFVLEVLAMGKEIDVNREGISKGKKPQRNWKLTMALAAGIVVAVLAVVVVLQGLQLSSAKSAKQVLEGEVELQKEMIEALREDALANETEEDDSLIHEDVPVITSSLISDQLDTIKELVTAEYLYTNAGQYENNKQMTIIKWDVDVPFSNKSFIVAYDGCITAGIDLNEAEIDINEEKRTITVTLPASEITHHETFEDTLVVLDESDGLFNNISIDNYNEFVSGQKTSMEQKAIERGILTTADEEARDIVKAFLALVPGMDTYTLTVK